MSVEENKELVRKLIDAINRKDTALLDAVCTPELAAGFQEGIQWIYTTFEGHHAEITDMVAEGGKVWCLMSTSGGHSAEFEGIPPTGKHWTNTVLYFVRVADGKVAEVNSLYDNYGLLKQLGATMVLKPTPEPA
jgi:predicted ester cyclase